MRAVFLRHPGAVSGPGLVDTALRALGFDTQVADADGSLEAARAADVVVALGGPHDAAANRPGWLVREVAFLQDRLASGGPVLGICLGAQLVARAAGGGVTRAPRPARGWFVNEDAAAAWRGPWFRWHQDQIVLPEGAQLLATGPGNVQGFRVASAFGAQFHIEADEDTVRNLAATLDEDARDPDWLLPGQASLARVRALLVSMMRHWGFA